MSDSTPGKPDHGAGITLDAARGRIITTASIVAVNLACILLLVFVDWPVWWKHINYELSALTWFSSVQLVLISLCCLFLALLCQVPFTEVRFPRGQRLLWLVLSGVFVLFTIDERFQIRDHLHHSGFGSEGATAHLLGIGAYELPMLLVALGGIYVAYRLFLYFAGDPVTRVWLVVGVTCALASTLVDIIDLSAQGELVVRNQQFIEEIFETLGQMGLFVAFARHAWRLLERVRLVPV